MAMQDSKLDLAIALSMQVPLQSEKNRQHKNKFDSDLDLAIALSMQDSNDLITRSAAVSDTCSRFQKSPKIVKSGKSVPRLLDGANFSDMLSSLLGVNSRNIASCVECKQLCENGIRFQNLFYHSCCFRCAACNRLLDELFVARENQPYHIRCSEELFNPKCSICDLTLTGQFFHHNFFIDEKYCCTHDMKYWRYCFSCNRKEPQASTRKDHFNNLPDGRCICFECVESAVLDSTEAKPLYIEVLNFMDSQLGLKVTHEMKEVAVLAVDVSCLNEQRGNSVICSHKNDDRRIELNNQSTVRGLTIHSRSMIQHMTPGSIQWNPKCKEYQSVPGSTFCTDEIREVTAVLVLYGLPRDLTASILAHEAMHVWMKLTKTCPVDLPEQVEEGLCQLISSKYLQYLSLSVPESISTETLRGYFLYTITDAEDEVYGEGYRKANRCCTAIGLEELLEHIKTYKDFPII